MAAEGDVRDDVELLAGLVEGPLERLVEARRDDQLARAAALAEQTRRPEPAPGATGRGHVVAGEEPVELVVERATPFISATYWATCARSGSPSGG